MKKVRKAVIAVAGLGTRFLPITKTIPKEMLPILDKPIVQYIVEELSASGIEEIIFVTNSQKETIKSYFSPAFKFEAQLIKQGKKSLANELKRISTLAKFVYVDQVKGYGNALPLITVEKIIGNEPFIYAFGDDLVKSRVPFTKQLIETYERLGCSVIGVGEVSSKEVSKYGIVKLKGSTKYVEDIVEKPSIHTAPSNLAVFGRYLFTPDVFKAMRGIKKGKGNEYWTADGIKILADRSSVATKKVEGGHWLTTGDPASYLKALIEYAKDNPKFKKIVS